MTQIQIDLKEYRALLAIAYAAESYLEYDSDPYFESLAQDVRKNLGTKIKTFYKLQK
tara:strand:+ start:355 stop:525 length:171 start_codon:yes stop_codon:yes gene_type:complete